MKLAEALQERADLIRKIAQLSSRINDNALVQEGEKPNEDPKAMLAELRSCVDRLEKLVAAINNTNCTVKVDGVTLTRMIARKDTLRSLQSVLRSAIEAASQSTYRARGAEIKIVSTLDVGTLRKESDSVAKELRLLDNKLQQANWTFDLIEE